MKWTKSVHLRLKTLRHAHFIWYSTHLLRNIIIWGIEVEGLENPPAVLNSRILYGAKDPYTFTLVAPSQQYPFPASSRFSFTTILRHWNHIYWGRFSYLFLFQGWSFPPIAEAFSKFSIRILLKDLSAGALMKAASRELMIVTAALHGHGRTSEGSQV